MTDTSVSERWERQMQVRLVRGEAAALGELYDRHGRLVHALAARLVGEEKAARDVVVRVFAQLWQYPESFDPGRQRLRTWLAVETYERATARVTVAPSASGSDASAPGHGDLLQLERVARADAAISTMNAGMRAALHLVHTGALDYRQAAAALGIGHQEVLRRLRQGLQAIAGQAGTTEGEQR